MKSVSFKNLVLFIKVMLCEILLSYVILGSVFSDRVAVYGDRLLCGIFLFG